jgi:hypothetical protein
VITVAEEALDLGNGLVRVMLEYVHREMTCV